MCHEVELESVIEHEDYIKVIWDFSIQTDHVKEV